jgi:glycosyltransferase involved in cell wall biosynthesis
MMAPDMEVRGELAVARRTHAAPGARSDGQGSPQQRSLSVSIVLPAYNEDANVQQALAEATAMAERLFAEHEIIVVDDGSHDRTAELARAVVQRDPRVRVISHGRNHGYGEALRTGFLASRLDFVFFTDADLQFDVNELERFLPYVGTVDVVAGYRINRQDSHSRRLMAYAWNLLMRVLFYVPVRDIDCAFKLLDRRILAEVDIESVGAMVNTELMVKLGRKGASVVEVGVHHRPRRAGQARGASPRVIATAFREVLRMRKRLASLDGRGL